MARSSSRRDFLRTTSGVAVAAGLGSGDWLAGLPRVSAQEARPDARGVPFLPEMEPLVRLIEDTPRERLLEEVAAKIRSGVSYREVVGSLLLAGIRNVQPRPAVGFKFHSVLVVNSAHLASLASPDEQRWLPIFWALDYFKDAQAQDVREGNWTMAPVDESKLPPASRAREAFVQAMDRWDEAQADVAAAALARSCGAGELFDLFCRYGARDYRSIGHKAIYVSNAFRTLACIGWQHAEPVLRSLTYALLNHSGEANPSDNDFEADRAGRKNRERLARLRPDWLDGKVDAQATRDLLSTLYAGSSDEMCEQVVELINRGISPQSIWDALLTGSGELLMRQSGIVGLHTLTTSNAMRYAFDAATHAETRQFLLLQNAAFLPLFRQAMAQRGKVGDVKLIDLEPLDVAAGADGLAAIFEDVSGDRLAAARRTLAYAQRGDDPQAFIRRARELVFLKGRDSHDYKFSSAVLEDFSHVSADFRNRFLAASVFNLRGSRQADSPLVARTRQAIGA